MKYPGWGYDIGWWKDWSSGTFYISSGFRRNNFFLLI